MTTVLLQFLLGTVFLTIIFSHIAKKNLAAVLAYGIQSLAISAILFNSGLTAGNVSLLAIAGLTLLVKAVLAPVFFVRLIKKYELKFTVSTFLNLPLTLVVMAALTAIAHADKFSPLTGIVPDNQTMLSVALSAIFLSLFLIVNNKGAIAQILGVLSLENSIVAFAVFAGLEQSPGLQFGIIFDIFVWLFISTTFVSMMQKHFGSLDVTAMKQLKD